MAAGGGSGGAALTASPPHDCQQSAANGTSPESVPLSELTAVGPLDG